MGSPSVLRKLNDRAALYALLESGPLSRRELEQAAGVSRPAAVELLRRLEEVGLAREAGTRPGGRGPDARLWAINERAAFAAGLDVNEFGVDAVVADLSGRALAEGTVVIREHDDPAQVVKQLLTTTARRAGIRRSDLAHVVVGISGSVDPATGALNHADHIPEWLGFDVQARLSEVLGLPVVVENDVKLVLGYESTRGRAVGCADVLLLWMGRGTATAVIADGRMLRGFHGSAGEVGYVPAAPTGAVAGEQPTAAATSDDGSAASAHRAPSTHRAPGGREGLGGRAIGDLLASEGVLELAAEHGIPTGDCDALELLELARQRRDATDESFLRALAARIAEVLASPVAILDPELIILAGDVGIGGGDDLAELVRARLHGMLDHRPRVCVTSGHDNSVRQGAVDASLSFLRESVFDDARNHREVSA